MATPLIGAAESRSRRRYVQYPASSSDAAETQRCIGATKSKGVCEGDSSATSLPQLCYEGDVVQVELWLGAVQVQGRRQHTMVAGQGRECCLQGPGGAQQMSCGSLGGGDRQTMEV